MTGYSYQTAFIPLSFPFQDKAKKAVPDVKAKAERLKKTIRYYLHNTVEIEAYFNKYVAELFDFRMAALGWLTENHILIEDLPSLFEKSIAALHAQKEYQVLCENMEFAFRTNLRAINQLTKSSKNGEKNKKISDRSNVETPAQFTYETYLMTLSHTVPEPIFSLLTDWVHASLAIEFSICSAAVMAEDDIRISPQKVDELASFVANATHEFGAITLEMKKISTFEQQHPSHESSENETKEQILLAEAGLNEYASELLPYDFD